MKLKRFYYRGTIDGYGDIRSDPQMSHVLYAYDPLTKSRVNYIKSKFSYVLNYLFEEINKNTELNLNERTLYRGKSYYTVSTIKKSKKQESDIHIDYDEIEVDNLLYMSMTVMVIQSYMKMIGKQL